MSGLLQEQPIYSHRQVQLPARAATAEAETPHHEAWDVTGDVGRWLQPAERQLWCSVRGASRFCGVCFLIFLGVGRCDNLPLFIYIRIQMTHTHTLHNLYMRNAFLIRISSPRQWLRALRGKPGRLLLGHWDAFGGVADGLMWVIQLYRITAVNQ